MTYHKLYIYIACSMLSIVTKAQTINNVSQYANIFEPVIVKSEIYKVSKHNKNIFHAVFNTLFVGYKHLVSSQDANRCSFYPSCSVYALQAIQKHGAIIGVLQGFDRLTRCNGQSPELYDTMPDSDLLYDPVK